MGLFSSPLSISLKTHTVYPEVVVLENGSWEARLISSNGEVMEFTAGPAPTKRMDYFKMRSLATELAYKFFKQHHKSYLIEGL